MTNIKRPADFKPGVFCKENGWEETSEKIVYYTQQQVGEMLEAIYAANTATFYSPLGKDQFDLVEEWLVAAYTMRKDGQNPN